MIAIVCVVVRVGLLVLVGVLAVVVIVVCVARVVLVVARFARVVLFVHLDKVWDYSDPPKTPGSFPGDANGLTMMLDAEVLISRNQRIQILRSSLVRQPRKHEKTICTSSARAKFTLFIADATSACPPQNYGLVVV